MLGASGLLRSVSDGKNDDSTNEGFLQRRSCLEALGLRRPMPTRARH